MEYDPEVFHFSCPPENIRRVPSRVPLLYHGGQEMVAAQDTASIQEEDVAMDCECPLPGESWSSASLTTVNFDVQTYIMGFLPTPALSSLMRTSRILLDAGINILCARTNEPLITPQHVLSMLHFLRLDAPSTRVSRIKALHFSLEEYRSPLTKSTLVPPRTSMLPGSNPNAGPSPPAEPPSYFALPETHPVLEETLLREARNNALAAFLTVLRACPALERVRVDRWYDDAPPALLHAALAALPCLSELRMPLLSRAGALWACAGTGVGVGAAPGLASCPLRSLVLRPWRWAEVPEAFAMLAPLADTLEELDLPVCRWVPPARPFSRVKKLGIEFPMQEDVVRALVSAFPNLEHLALRGTRNYHLCHTQRAREEEDRMRERSQYEWIALSARSASESNDDYGEGNGERQWPWPALQSVSGESACALYTLALPRRVNALSVAYAAGDPADSSLLPALLVDARPDLLELRVRQAHYKYVPLPARFTGLRAAEGAADVRKLVLTVEGDGVPDYVKVASILTDELQTALPALPNLTHLLLAHRIAHFRAARDTTRRAVRALLADAPARALSLARAAASSTIASACTGHGRPALRVVAILVRVEPGADAPAWLMAWRVVSRPTGVSPQWHGEEEEEEGWWDGEESSGLGPRHGLERPSAVPVGRFRLVPLSEEDAWDVLRAEGMEAYARES